MWPYNWRGASSPSPARGGMCASLPAPGAAFRSSVGVKGYRGLTEIADSGDAVFTVDYLAIFTDASTRE